MLRIDPEFESLLIPLTSQEYGALEASLLEEGCRDPLVLWGETLVDGHNRYKLCQQHGIVFSTVQHEFETPAHAKVWMLKNQAARRNLNGAQKDVMALRLQAELNVVYEQNKLANLMRGDKVPDSPKSENRGELHDSWQEAADTFQTSRDSMSKTKAVLESDDEQTKEDMLSGEISRNQAHKKVKTKEKIKKRRKAVKESVAATPAYIQQADVVDWLESRPEQCDLLFTDPPYSTDVDNIQQFAADWLPVALSRIKSTGRAYIFIGAYPEELLAYLSVAIPTQVLVWTYNNTIGPLPSHFYKQNWQAILYYAMPDAPALNEDILTERFSSQVVNAPDGRHDGRYHAWEKPLSLAQQLVRQATKVGDLIYDPFAGTGTFLLAGASLGRNAYGCDINPEMIAIAKERGCVEN